MKKNQHPTSEHGLAESPALRGLRLLADRKLSTYWTENAEYLGLVDGKHETPAVGIKGVESTPFPQNEAALAEAFHATLSTCWTEDADHLDSFGVYDFWA